VKAMDLAPSLMHQTTVGSSTSYLIQTTMVVLYIDHALAWLSIQKQHFLKSYTISLSNG